jgi:hypothetical protein
MNALIPTVVGGVLAIAGGFAAKFWQDHADRKSLRCALAAEIRAFLYTLEREKLRELFKDTYDRISRENRLPRFPVAVRTVYNSVFSGAAGKLGQLDASLVGDLVEYYYTVQTVVELMEIFSANLQDICDRGAETDSEEIREQLELLADIIKLTDEAREKAVDLVNRLER